VQQQLQVGPEAIKGKRPSGWVEMREVQAAYIGSGSAGAGTLTFRSRRYPFKVGGLGIGGIGLSTIEAQGEVYDLGPQNTSPAASCRQNSAAGRTSMPSSVRRGRGSRQTTMRRPVRG
jgi:hypothetical protein